MSVQSALTNVSHALQELLWNAVSADPSASAILSDKQHISLRSPSELSRAGVAPGNYLSLFLYQVRPDAVSPNRPLHPGLLPASPPALNLRSSYVLTPLTASAETDQALLASAMNALHNIAVLQLGNQKVQIVPVDQTKDQYGQFWQAMEMPMKLAMFYDVGPVSLS